MGHTDDLARRIWEHQEKVRPGFTRKIRRRDPGLVRGPRHPRVRSDPRAPDEEMAPALEAGTHRTHQPGLARSGPGSELLDRPETPS
ncbi:GIY-YIG nuclease family protein [Caulobacter endophyticus]|uniref:hypothetical protein n=1 Tax=Caulobacter endophyticus TaxID=2172652 RepID=UPI002FCE3D4A